MADISIPQGCSVSDFFWAAGFLEGEGCFFCNPYIVLDCCQVQLEPLARLRAIIGGTIKLRQKRKPEHSPIHVLRLYGKSAARWMQALRPVMSPRRQAQIDKALEKRRTNALKRPRGEGVGGLCARGHLVVGDNIVRSGRVGELRCKACTYDLQARYRQRQRVKRRERATLVHESLTSDIT